MGPNNISCVFWAIGESFIITNYYIRCYLCFKVMGCLREGGDDLNGPKNAQHVVQANGEFFLFSLYFIVTNHYIKVLLMF